MKYAFESLTSVSFIHTYYSSQLFNSLLAAPSAQTEKVLQNHGLIFKRKAAGFNILFDTLSFGDIRSREDVLQYGLDCEFYLTLQDKEFYNYTALPGLDLRTHYFRFSNVQADGKKIKQSLHRKKFVAEDELVEFVPVPGLPFSRPFAVLNLSLQDGLPLQYSITFSSKETYWRYILTGSDLNGLGDPAILDSSGEPAFEGPEEIELPNGKGLIFKSLNPITLSETSKNNFQLVENFNKESGKYKVVMRALPRADPGRITSLPGNNDTEQHNYSEIFIH